MSQPEIFSVPIPKRTIQRLADEEFGNMVKFVVDLEEKIICAGGGLHSDAKDMLIDKGSDVRHLWGSKFYLERPFEKRYEFASMINIRPKDGNTTQVIGSVAICRKISGLADHYFKPFYEKSVRTRHA